MKYEELFNDTFLEEEFLDENIPRDLVAAYRKASGYSSQRNPESSHTELQNAHRRTIKYDYGKSDYQVISPEDAIRLVRQDKHNIQKLRIIYQGDLVEYEVRDNGSVYAIYGNSDRTVTLGDKSYKNIRYAPWKAVIENADKIYITDEYEHPLYNDQETQQRRQHNNTVRKIIRNPITRDDSDYDSHKPYDNYTRNAAQVYTQRDTGTHNIGARIGYYGNYQNYSSKLDIVRKRLEQKAALYIEYDIARRGLKKLISQKDTFDEEEYEQLYAEFKQKLDVALSKYNDAAKKAKNAVSKYVIDTDEATANFSEAVLDYLKKVQDLLDRGFYLKKEYEQRQVTNINAGRKSSASGNYDLKNVSRDLENLISQLLAAKKELENLRLAGITSAIKLSDKESDIVQKTSKLESLIAAFEEIKNKFIKEHLQKLQQIEAEMHSVDTSLADLRPHTAERKAVKAAKNKQAELDPALADIVQFVDFSGAPA